MKKIIQELNWSRSSPNVIVLESENGNKGTLQESKAKEKESDGSRKKRELHDT